MTWGVANYSATPVSNAAINGINIAENCNASGINDAIRQLMADIAAAATEGTIASASTTDLGTVGAMRIAVTGTNAITNFGTKANVLYRLRFTGSLVLTYNGTSLITPTGANIQTANGDQAVVVSDGSGNWTVLSYAPAGGVLLNSFSGTNLASSYAQVAAVALTPGKWRLSAAATVINTVTAAYMSLAISTTTASSTGSVDGLTKMASNINGVSVGACVIPGVDVTVTANTTYFLNINGNGTGTAALAGHLRAERII